MDKKKFSRIAESLRKFQRAELKEFESELGQKPVDKVYVDPLDDNAVLDTVLAGNTTFLFGRKGTGKSTIISRAQSELRKNQSSLSIYLDVKSINEASQTSSVLSKFSDDRDLIFEIIQPHILRKAFLIEIFTKLIDELDSICKQTSIIDRFLGRHWKYEDLKFEIDSLKDTVRNGVLHDAEMPILQLIEKEVKNRHQEGVKRKGNADIGSDLSLGKASLKTGFKSEDIEEVLDDDEVYEKYSQAILRTFPYQDFIKKLSDLLEELSFSSLVIFFDDFSELTWIEQRLFVDVILAPLNNTSDEKIKLKVAAYPGRAYYGNIDPGKIDILNLDFYHLYKSSDVQTMEAKAVDYTRRLLENRFSAFGVKLEDYFSSVAELNDYYTLLFQASFNVPRLIGHILHTCYLDQISRNEKITLQSIRLASKKYYDNVLSQYFDRKNRYATEPFSRKLDRHNQHRAISF